jgi:phosphoribosylformylglycinamidine (FGAM) synthase PurS component
VVYDRSRAGYTEAGCKGQKEMIFSYEVIVESKKEVPHPEGTALLNSLQRAGFHNLKGVKISKRFVLEIEAGTTRQARKTALKLSKEHLANYISEIYKINRRA